MRNSIVAVLALAMLLLAGACEKEFEGPVEDPIADEPIVEVAEGFAGKWVDQTTGRSITISEDLTTIVYQDAFLNAKARNVEVTEESFVFTMKYLLRPKADTYCFDLAGALIENNVLELTQLKLVIENADGKTELNIPQNFGIFERE